MRLVGVQPDGPEGPVLTVAGADLLDGTPIYDIKPYLPGVDAHPEAAAGLPGPRPPTRWPCATPAAAWPPCRRGSAPRWKACCKTTRAPATSATPRASTALAFAGYTVRFTVDNDVLTVLELKAE